MHDKSSPKEQKFSCDSSGAGTLQVMITSSSLPKIMKLDKFDFVPCLVCFGTVYLYFVTFLSSEATWMFCCKNSQSGMVVKATWLFDTLL